MIRPWYRSRLFWLGVPGLVFLLWAWWDSNRIRRWAWFHPDNLVSTQGKVFWHRIEVAARIEIGKDGEISTTFYEAYVDFCEGDISVASQSGPFESSGVAPYVPRFGVLTEPVNPSERRWFPPPRWRSEQLDAEASYHFLSLPYWLLTAGYVAAWTTALILWQRRKARLLNHSAAELSGMPQRPNGAK